MKYLYIRILIAAFILGGCKASERFSGSESVSVTQLKEKYKSEVAFTLTNVSSEVVQIESTQHLYIEMSMEGNWKRVPYIPCACGTPCRPPSVSEVNPNEPIEISWNRISRKCGNEGGMAPPVKTIEEKVKGGEYRMTFNVNRQKDGMRLTPEKLVVSFSLRD